MPRTTQTSTRSTTPARSTGGAVRFELANWLLLSAGFTVVVAGFVLLGRGSTVAAPLLLMLGFLIFIPWGIIK